MTCPMLTWMSRQTGTAPRNREGAPGPSSTQHVIDTACPLDCPDSCSLAVTVSAGRVVEIDGSRGRGRWQVFEFLQGVQGGGGQNVARYRDDYVRCADGRWRFARRELLVTYLGPADLNDPERG